MPLQYLTHTYSFGVFVQSLFVARRPFHDVGTSSSYHDLQSFSWIYLARGPISSLSSTLLPSVCLGYFFQLKATTFCLVQGEGSTSLNQHWHTVSLFPSCRHSSFGHTSSFFLNRAIILRVGCLSGFCDEAPQAAADSRERNRAQLPQIVKRAEKTIESRKIKKER